ETDPKIAIHLKVIAGDEQHALFGPKTLDEGSRIDAMLIAHEKDRSGLRRYVRQPGRSLVDPIPHQGVIRRNDAASARKEEVTSRQRDASKAIVDGAGRNRCVIVHPPEFLYERHGSRNPAETQAW